MEIHGFMDLLRHFLAVLGPLSGCFTVQTPLEAGSKGLRGPVRRVHGGAHADRGAAAAANAGHLAATTEQHLNHSHIGP